MNKLCCTQSRGWNILLTEKWDRKNINTVMLTTYLKCINPGVTGGFLFCISGDRAYQDGYFLAF